ncbi:oligosaccharide flippase family protein [Gemmatimonadota bacterium]
MTGPDPTTQPAARENAWTGSRLLARNSILNLLGQGFPLIVALVAFPFLTRGLGPDRFGLLALAWTFIGYFTVFDFGLSRSLTQMVAERLGRGGEEEIPEIAWTGFILMHGLGIFGAVVFLALAPWIVDGLLSIPSGLRTEAFRTFFFLALSLPIFIGTIGFRGILEAHQRFGLINLVRAPMGSFLFLGPLVVLPFTQRLDVVVGVLVLARVLAWALHAFLCLRVAPELRAPRWISPGVVPPLLRLGGWITVSNLVSPILHYADRFLIGAVLSLSAVAFYATPHEVMSRVLILPMAVAGVFFPAFAAGHKGDPTRTGQLFQASLRGTLLLVIPILLSLLALAETGLGAWAGPEYGENGAVVVRWLAVGVLFNCIAQVPFALVQGIGRPDISARFHLLEVPVYLVGLWWALGQFGLAGAAFIWSARAILDSALLFGASSWLMPEARKGTRMALGWALGASAAFGLAVYLGPILGSWITLLIMLSGFGVLAWVWLIPKGTGTSFTQALLRVGVLTGAVLSGGFLWGIPGLAAQESPPPHRLPRVLAPAETVVNNEVEDYLRFLGTAGQSAPYPWGIRGLSPREIRLLVPDSTDHPWAGRLDVGVGRIPGPSIRLLSPRIGTTFNSTFPFGGNDGPVWAGKGFTGASQLGILAEWGPVSLRLAPTVFWAQNADFTLRVTGEPDHLVFADARSPTRIDNPQRFGEAAYYRMDPGESSLRLDTRFLTIGASTAAQHWGPARHYPTILGNNAGGFPHVFVGTGSPIPIGIGTLHARTVWGRLEQSDFSPAPEGREDRFGSSAVMTFTPRGVPGLEIGFARFFHLPWREGGPILEDFLRPFEGLLKTSLSEEEVGADTDGGSRENQLASGFFRWVFPTVGLELYSELAREDHSWDFRDFLVEPDHNDLFTVGLAKVWESGPSGWWALRGELVNARISHLEEVRPQKLPYRHAGVVQGHTHFGQILGSPAASGGSGATLEVLRYSPSGRWRFWWERAQRTEGENPDGEWVVDARHSLGASILHFNGPLEISGGIAGTWNLNRDLGEHAWNVRLDLGASYVLTRW